MPRNKTKQPGPKIDIKRLLSEKPIITGSVSTEVINAIVDHEKRPKPNIIPSEQDLTEMNRASHLLNEIKARKNNL